MDKFCMTKDALARLMPMHLILGLNGEILQCGPTVAKLFVDRGLLGQSFFDCFDVSRPGNMLSVADILKTNGAKLHLSMRNEHHTMLKAVGVALEGQDGVLLDMSFGISVVDTIGTYNLTIADFAATDDRVIAGKVAAPYHAVCAKLFVLFTTDEPKSVLLIVLSPVPLIA